MPNLLAISHDSALFERVSQELYAPERHGGEVIAHALDWNGRNAVVEEIMRAQNTLKKAPLHEGPVMQDMFIFYYGEGDTGRVESDFPLIQRLRSEYLPWLKQLGNCAGFVPHINSIGVHHYPAGSEGISPHQDYFSDKNTISLFVLKGNAPLYLCRDRNKTDSVALEASPGDLILLRAPRNDAEKPFRPFHYLEKLIEERLTLIFRQRQK